MDHEAEVELKQTMTVSKRPATDAVEQKTRRLDFRKDKDDERVIVAGL